MVYPYVIIQYNFSQRLPTLKALNAHFSDEYKYIEMGGIRN